MNKSIKTLLELLLETSKTIDLFYLRFGICYLAMITLKDRNEYLLIQSYILNNRPTYNGNRKYYLKDQKDSQYYWPKGDWDIRRKWLEDEIKKLS